ncbi:hypothetical protein CEXT_101281 [Caerostris extrusa]|uniref:Uncharacterized protein n=1 Tax=Caerostris extrusa TaxID=172846 RepID=A0AAV4U574_CAEEX|nr:hypothetical protein CEXT_101281 [Caerostris extrusa]
MDTCLAFCLSLLDLASGMPVASTKVLEEIKEFISDHDIDIFYDSRNLLQLKLLHRVWLTTLYIKINRPNAATAELMENEKDNLDKKLNRIEEHITFIEESQSSNEGT